MKLYQKVSILAVVGALSLNCNVKAEDEALLTDDQVADIQKDIEAAYNTPDGKSNTCKVCDKLNKSLGDGTKSCSSTIKCIGDISGIVASLAKKVGLGVCDQAHKKDHEKTLCDYNNWAGSYKGAIGKIVGYLSKGCAKLSKEEKYQFSCSASE